MMKKMLLIAAATVAFPAMAQEQPPADPAAPPPAEQPAPTPEASTPPAGNTATQPAPAGAAANATQIAQIVEKEFPTYDSDANGELNAAEFAAWMKKLRAATEPGVDTESAAVKTWVGQAFAAADTDKSTSVNKTELTGFLSRGA